MKLAKSLALGAVALAAVGSAFATNVVVTGSTAFRKSLYAAAINQLTALDTAAGLTPAVKVAYYGNAALNSAAQATFVNANGDSVQCCMAGSVGGVNWVVNNLTVATDKDRAGVATGLITVSTAQSSGYSVTVSTAQGSLATTASGAAPLASLTSSNTTSGTADFTMSDSLQDSTPYDSTSTGVSLSQAGTNDYASIGTGVVLFVFAKGDATGIGSTAGARFTNMTPLAFLALASNGYANLATFTGNASDATYNVVLTGRDNDSGTRLATAFETGFGNVNAPFKQYSLNGSTFADVGSSATVASLSLSSDTTAGYSSGGKVKDALNATMPASITVKSKSVILCSYVGTGDIPATSKVLSYNGVSLYDSTGTQTPVVVEQGQYTFWTYEQAYYNPNRALSDGQANLINGIADDIALTYAASSGGLHISNMACSRAGEGMIVFHN